MHELVEVGLFMLAMLMIILLIVGAFLYFMKPILADDTDSDLGFCLRGYNWYCDKVDFEKLYKEVCDIDESYCLYGVPDPDFADNSTD